MRPGLSFAGSAKRIFWPDVASEIRAAKNSGQKAKPPIVPESGHQPVQLQNRLVDSYRGMPSGVPRRAGINARFSGCGSGESQRLKPLGSTRFGGID
jgi:hypothetical protein